MKGWCALVARSGPSFHGYTRLKYRSSLWPRFPELPHEDAFVVYPVQRTMDLEVQYKQLGNEFLFLTAMTLSLNSSRAF